MFLTDIINKLALNENVLIWGICLGQEFTKEIKKISHTYQTLNILIEHTEHGKTKIDKVKDSAIKHLLMRKVLKLEICFSEQCNDCIKVQIDM